MIANQIMFYNTTIDEAQEMLEMESRRDNAMINFEEFQVKLNKRGPNVLVSLIKSIDEMSIQDGLVQLKVDFPGKFRDMESIERVQAVLALNPNSDWWKGILADLQTGDPLHYRVEEILIETEERIENPDEDVLAKLNQAIAQNPRFRILQSFKQQVLSGRELSSRQMKILEENLGSSIPASTNQIDRINEALALDPRNNFVNQLKQKAENGITLSTRQMNVVEEIIASQSSPASKLLADLKSNAYLDRDDFMLINKGQRRGIDSLNDEERKRLRHLIYRNERKLDNSYSKEEVRRLLKKGSQMRRLASEVIRELEMRIARLEGNLNRTASMTREARSNVMEDLNTRSVKSVDMYHEGKSLESEGAMLYYLDEGKNHSKFYELRLYGREVLICHGRIGTKTPANITKDFDSAIDAEVWYQKQLKSKLRKGYVSAFATKGEHSSTSNNYGKYPMGSTSNAGPWQNQDISYQQDTLTETIDAVEGAISSFLLDGIVDRDAVKVLQNTYETLLKNTDSISKDAVKDIRLALDHIQGQGRVRGKPVEHRSRQAVKILKKLIRKLNSAMSGGHRRASLRGSKKKRG